MLGNLKLLNGFVGKILQQAADYVVLVVAAVNVDVNLPAVAAAEGDGADVRLGRIKCADRARLRNNNCKAGKRAIQKRQVLNFGWRDDATYLRLSSLERYGVRRDLNGRSDLA